MPPLFKSLLSTFALMSCVGAALAQHVGHRHGLIADEYDARTAVLTPTLAAKAGSVSALFEVEYEGFTAEAQQAFEHALSVWATHIASPIPIRIQARWGTLESSTLGSAGPPYVVSINGSPHSSTWYPPALASAISGHSVLSAGQFDITASFNSSRTDWYFGTDGATPIGTFDFATVVMHEIGHGLGMISSFKIEGDSDSGADSCTGASEGEACWGITPGNQTQPWPFVTDRFIFDASQSALLDPFVYPVPSVALANVLTSGGLHFDGPGTRSTYSDSAPRLYAPAAYAPASSVAHLDEDDFPPGDPNSLMTPRLARAEAIHSPGPVFCGILADIGWPLGGSCIYLIENPLTGQDEDDGTDDGGSTGDESDGDDEGSGSGEEGSPVSVDIPVLADHSLAVEGPYPNPTAGTATINVLSGNSQRVEVSIMDLTGRRLYSLADVHVTAGSSRAVPLSSTGLAPGVYIVRIAGPHAAVHKTLVVVR